MAKMISNPIRPKLVRSAVLGAALCGVLAASPALAAKSGKMNEKDTDLAAMGVVELIRLAGGTISNDVVVDELTALFAASEAQKDINDVPEAFFQAIRFSFAAENLATREMSIGMSRDLLDLMLRETDVAEDSVIKATWEEVDPAIRTDGSDNFLRQSDLDAFERLRARMPEAAQVDIVEFWDSRDNDVDRMLPAFYSAWEAGAAAVWDDLDDEERALIAGALDNPEIPPGPLLKKVIGTDDMLAWLAVVDYPLTQKENRSSPELTRFTSLTGFAGPLQKHFEERILAAARQGGGGGGGGMSDLFWQNYRAQNWQANNWESTSWDAYRYTTMGY